jgi:hypothetical protein
MKIDYILKFSSRNERKKRQSILIDTRSQNNLFFEFLLVVDSTVYNLFKNDFGSNLDDSYVINYIKIFFSQIANGVKIKRYFSNSHIYFIVIDQSKIPEFPE